MHMCSTSHQPCSQTRELTPQGFLGIIYEFGCWLRCIPLLQRGPIPMIKRTGIFLVGTVFMISTALAQMAPAKTGDTPKGKVLVNDKGMTLYVFDKDKDMPGKSACNGTCAENWPALLASDTDKASGD